MDYGKRINKVRQYLEEKNFPALLLKNSSNIFYLTGLLEIDGFLVVDKREATFFVPEMFYHECRDARWRNENIDVRTYSPSAFHGFLGRYKKTAVIETELSHASVVSLRKKHILVFLPDFIKDMRAFKDADELKLVKKALAINKRVFKEIEKKIVPGRTETDIAGEIHHLIRKYGGRREAFEPIVASGRNSAYPHHKSRNTAVKSGQPLVIDAGVDYCGYKSDLTRTFFPGSRPDGKRIADVYGMVEETLKKTKDFVKSGMTGREIYRYAFNILEKYGMEKYFIHGLGHGVGIDVHEKPVLNSKSGDVVGKGSVFTIEPGIYIPGMGGVRLEDTIIFA